MNTPRLPRVVFLGTPEVVVPVAQRIYESKDVCELSLVVTQPPARRGRGRESAEMPSPVATWATERNLPVLTPEKAGEPKFIEQLVSVQPDVCVTAAYGQYLPRAFLAVPKLGTLNIHPSLLPKFRGAAPVQRALEAGLRATGVTILFSTSRMDAGPIVAQSESPIGESEDALCLLQRLFREGSELLINVLDTYRQKGADGIQGRDQDDSLATEAPKIQAHEGLLVPGSMEVHEFINKIRAFALWPGVKIEFELPSGPTPVKIIKARESVLEGSRTELNAWFSESGLCVRCKSRGTVLEILELQLPGKRVMSARDVRNGWPGGCPRLSK